MASVDQVKDAMILATIQAMLKYSGGKAVSKKAKKSLKSVPDKEAIMRSHFARTNSGIYPPLSPGYAKYKLGKVGKKPILVFSGKMRDSLVGKAKIFDLGGGKFRMTFPKATKYAGFHKKGAALGSGVNLKKRDPTGLTKKDKKRYGAAYGDSLRTLLRGLGKKKFSRNPNPKKQ